MVVIRLSRGGSKKRPFYRVVVADKRCARDGRYIEQIGYFNPIARGQEKRTYINDERYTHWLSVGAQASDRVRILIKEIVAGPKEKSVEPNTAPVVAKTEAPVVEGEAVSEAPKAQSDTASTATDIVDGTTEEKGSETATAAPKEDKGDE